MKEILPGPSSRVLITDNAYHVSDNVWRGIDRGPIECFGASRLLHVWVLSNAQKELLHDVGFGLFADQDVGVQNDTALVSALVERWRPETNTFFMRRGEMTITLEDVGYILGLPILGQPLAGPAIQNPASWFKKYWFEPLSDEDFEAAWSKSGIKFTWLYERYGRAGVEGDPERIAVHTQAYLMLVLGVVLFPTRSRSFVHPRFIGLLRDVSQIHTYSWGSGVLAYLYRALGMAVRKDSTHIAGCMLLLQIWSYERFDIGLPTPFPGAIRYPVALYWAYPKTKSVLVEEAGKEEEVVVRLVLGKRRRGSKGPHHNLPHYRAEFDGVGSDRVQWTPYDEEEEEVDEDLGEPVVIRHMDWDQIEAQLAGQSRLPLICFDICEYQHSDRVLRQFGLRPCIPRAPVDMTPYRVPKQRFRAENWMAVWFAEIAQWRRFCDRPDIALCDDTLYTTEDAYMEWYLEVSRRGIGKPKPVPQPDYASH
ncbi:protein MAIN-LIKE 1-like [Daucus carota subsp. sativus]|uniref:protein MAIN-LIKE 1-like n=1 Tax=Daucus carota subsp. sativus TaxID=79200 RepID=UPI003083DC73